VKWKNKMPKFEKGDKVRVRSDSTSPYKGCTGVVEGVIKEESGFLYIVQFGRSGDLALTDNFMEEDLQTVGN
jgi:transcription antitermination factor NusG